MLGKAKIRPLANSIRDINGQRGHLTDEEMVRWLAYVMRLHGYLQVEDVLTGLLEVEA